jgi:hypothetical protein
MCDYDRPFGNSDASAKVVSTFRLCEFIRDRRTALSRNNAVHQLAEEPRVLNFTLPNHLNPPSCCEQLPYLTTISLHIVVKLLVPKGDPTLWQIGEPASRVPVPKASMHEDHSSIAWKDQIRATWKPRIMQPEPESGAVQKASNSQLRRGVLTPDSRHHPAAGLLVNDVYCFVLDPEVRPSSTASKPEYKSPTRAEAIRN